MLRLKHIISRILVISALMSGGGAIATAAPSQLTAKLDSAQLLMGNMTNLRLEIVTDKGRKGVLPLLAERQSDKGYIPLCGDSVELRYPSNIDTVYLGTDRMKITYLMPLQAFDSGTYRIPPMEYVSANDTAYSNAVTLSVVPVTGVTADSEISPMQGVVAPESGSWTSEVPDWLYYNWWWMLLALVALAAAIWLVVKLKKRGLKEILKRPEKPLEPWEEALLKLDELKARNLIEQGSEREYYTELTEILRVYLEKRFGIRALEMTSQQILDTLAEQGEDGRRRDYVRKILDMADFVKFAKLRPLPDEAEQSMDYAHRFVEETIPTPTVEENDPASSASNQTKSDKQKKD